MSEIKTIELKSETGFNVTILTLGGIIQKIMAKDRNNHRKNVVLSYKSINDYRENTLFLGCIIGPIAGRTANGLIKIGDSTIHLDTSCHPNSLHSCSDGLNLDNWTIKFQSNSKLILSNQSCFMGSNIDYEVTYSVLGETLNIEYSATSSGPVYLSLTNHSYFNLSGNPDDKIVNHLLQLNCTHYAKLNRDYLPIQLVPIKDSAMDFTSSKSIHEALDYTFSDIAMASGIDHPFKCDDSVFIAELKDPISGRMLQTRTTQSYVVVYTGNFLDTASSPTGKSFGNHTGICFETQDLPNVLGNELDIIRLVTPLSPYNHVTSYTFSTF